MALAAVFLSFWLIRPHVSQTATKPAKIVVTTPDNVKPPAPAVAAIENEAPVQPARDASRVRSNQPRSTEDSPTSDEPISVAQKPSLLSTNSQRSLANYSFESPPALEAQLQHAAVGAGDVGELLSNRDRAPRAGAGEPGRRDPQRPRPLIVQLNFWPKGRSD